jgi:hypothetical protein
MGKPTGVLEGSPVGTRPNALAVPGCFCGVSGHEDHCQRSDRMECGNGNKVMMDMIQAHPEIDLVVAANDYIAMAQPRR